MKLIVVILYLSFTGFCLKAQEIDTEKSFAEFEVKHMKNHIVEGTITGFQGEVHFNRNNIYTSRINISAEVSTINTDFERRDTMLLGKSYFDVLKYPKIIFKSTSFEQSNETYIVKGDLTIKETTEEISIPFTFTSTEKQMIFKGIFSIDRFDYEVGKNVSTITVSEKVNICIKCILKTKKSKN